MSLARPQARVPDGVWWCMTRTNIDIDDELVTWVMRAYHLKTKREAVELGLRTLLRLRWQARIRRFRGKLDWQGDLEAMRTD